MPNNDFLPFADAPGADVMSQPDYAALGTRATGFQTGTALTAQVNKVWRQASVIAAMIGTYVNNKAGADFLDNGDIATLEASLAQAISMNAVARIDVATVAGNVDLTAVKSESINLTGNLAVTGFEIQSGRYVHAVVAGTPTLTTDADLIVSGYVSGSVISLNPGDIFDIYGEAGGVARCRVTRLISGAPLLLSTLNISAPQTTATIILPGGFTDYEIRITGLRPTINNAIPWLRVSEDGGASLKAGGSDYIYAGTNINLAGLTSGFTSGAASNIALDDTSGIDNSFATSSYAGVIRVMNPSDAVTFKHIQGSFSNVYGQPSFHHGNFSGQYHGDAAAINAIGLLMSSGNIASGLIRLIGIP